MFSFSNERQPDVKSIRNSLLQSVKEKLQRMQGGEGANIMAVYVFFNCTEANRHLYEAAIYANVPGKFKNDEVQRIADDYAITLSPSFKFESVFTDKFPLQAEPVNGINAAIFISTNKAGLNSKQSNAYVKVLNGEAEMKMYSITSSTGRINIGRDILVQAAGNYMRKNTIAFKTNEANRSVSRQHAHIEWEAGSGSFLIFADEGGIPPYNKMKVRTTDGALIKMQATEVGHRLQEGDQVILGDAAVIEFSYSAEK